MNEVHMLLEQWARWVRVGSGMPGYKGAGFMFAQLRGSTLPEAYIDDEVALGVERALGLLKRLKPTQAEAVSVYYRDNCESFDSLGKKLDCAKSTAQRRFTLGMNWLEDCFVEQDLLAA